MLVDEETLIYLSTVDVERLYGAIGTITINAAKYMVPNLTKKFVHRSGNSTSKPLKLNAYYMCAYDL